METDLAGAVAPPCHGSAESWHLPPWQVTCAWLQGYGPALGGAGAYLGSHHRRAWERPEEQGLTSLDPGEVKPLLALPMLVHPLLEPRRLMAAGFATSGISLPWPVPHAPP
jgi:hypothetical protein